MPNRISRFRASLCAWALLLCALLFVTPSSFAQSSSNAAPAATDTGEPRAAVKVNNRTLFNVAGQNQTEAARRAEVVNRRLELLIEREEDVDKFQPSDILTQDGSPLVTLGGEPIVTVTSDDVADTLIPADQLALMWGKQLSGAVRAARFARTSAFSNAFVVLVTSARDLVNSVIAWSPRLLGVAVLALVFWPLARLARWVAKIATRSTRIDPNLTQLAIAIAFYGVWAMGALAMLSALGFNSAGIAAAVGASGFILGFAFQDVLSHFFAGMLLLVGRQFYIGGQIKVGEHEGIVERIDLRALYLRTFDNRQVTIPNGQVFNSAVVVNTSNPYRRREFTIGISYDSDPRKALELMLAAVRGVEGVLSEPPPEVYVTQLGASSVDILCFFYTRAEGNWLIIRSECILRARESLEANDISIPFSTHTIDVRHVGELTGLLQPALDAVAVAENGKPLPRLSKD